MLSWDARPRLAPRVRLRRDRLNGGLLLLYPENGLALNATAAEVVELCTGELSVIEISAQLAARHDADPKAILPGVIRFLEALKARALLRPEETL